MFSIHRHITASHRRVGASWTAMALYEGRMLQVPAREQARAHTIVPSHTLTLANVDSLRAWFNADIGPASGLNSTDCAIGARRVCCAVLEPTRSSRGGMPKYSR